jgi:hypothetical protein
VTKDRRHPGAAVWLASVLIALAVPRVFCSDPKIDKIERFSTNQVTIHFYTDANRTYELQFMDTLTCPTSPTATGILICNSNGVPAGAWSNLFVAPSLPFNLLHYVVLDTPSNGTRFYRLRVTP